MKIKIKPEVIASNCVIDEILLEDSIMDVYYDVVKLKLAILLRDKIIEITEEEINKYNQIYIKEYDIWINASEWEMI